MTITAPVATDEAPVGATITTGNQEPVTIPVSRYIDPAFAALEMERLWPRVWQVACSVDHVASPGDVYEYRCGPYSTLIVRGVDGELRAFQNVCRHRGSALCDGGAAGMTELRCPFHRWTWDLAGNLREVPSRRGFGVLRNEDYGLFPVAVGTWGPMVFVNPSLDAPPLADFLEGVPEDIAWVGLEDFRCEYLVSLPVPGNWKVVSDGFSETYHVQGLHREMLPIADDVNGPQRLWSHHGKLEQRYGVPSPRFRTAPSDQEVWDAFIEVMGTRIGVTEQGAFPGGGPVRDVLAAGVRSVGAAQGVAYDRFTDDQLLTMEQYNLFPNVSLVVFPDLFSILRSRPGPTPDEAFMDVFHFSRRAPGAPYARPADVDLPPTDDPPLGLVLGQDAKQIGRAHRGLKQPGFTRMTLSREECRILNLHRNLERWLGISPSEITGAADPV
ncbi:MAG TPA: aromatic ring-hydroxylating dioxygenase subunit alpha [Acidimicrobiales bacterium]|nr:aromatic ring-hydroxylating dioxygenase subunit alpha [Acidimicrobiales bacterium]